MECRIWGISMKGLRDDVQTCGFQASGSLTWFMGTF